MKGTATVGYVFPDDAVSAIGGWDFPPGRQGAAPSMCRVKIAQLGNRAAFLEKLIWHGQRLHNKIYGDRDDRQS